MGVNPAKALAALRIMEKHGYRSRAEMPVMQSVDREEVAMMLDSCRINIRYRSKIGWDEDRPIACAWPRGEFKKAGE